MATKNSFRVGSLFGIEVRIDYSWIVIFALVAWSFIGSVFPSTYPNLSSTTNFAVGLIATLLLFISVLTHEFAHSIYAKKHGFTVRSITLFIFGGVSEVEEKSTTPKDEIIMAALGPITSIVLSFGFFVLAILGAITNSDPVQAICGLLAVINFSLAIFNLMPAFPLDGGRVLRGLIWEFTGNVNKATTIAASAGKVFAYVLMALGLLEIFLLQSFCGLWFILIGTFLHATATATLRQTNAKQTLENLPVDKFMKTDFVLVPLGIKVDDFLSNYAITSEESLFLVINDKGEVVGSISEIELKNAKSTDAIDRYVHPNETRLFPGAKISENLDQIMIESIVPVYENGEIIGIVYAATIQNYVAGVNILRNLKKAN